MNLKLEIKIDNKLNFEHHIKTLFNKLSQILGALQKILIFLDPEKNSSYFNNKVSAQLPLTYLEVLNKEIDFFSEQISFEELYVQHLMAKNNLRPKTNQHSIKVLINKIYKFENDLSPLVIEAMF